jgi:hypothetical protein
MILFPAHTSTYCLQFYSHTVLNTIAFSLLHPITHAHARYPFHFVSLFSTLLPAAGDTKFSPDHHRQRKYESKGTRQDEPAETLLSLCIRVPFCGFSAPWCPCCRPGEDGAECPCGLGGGGR